MDLQPDSILEGIFGFLDGVSLLTSACTCRRWRGLIEAIIERTPYNEGLKTRVDGSAWRGDAARVRIIRASGFLDAVRVAKQSDKPKYWLDLLVASALINPDCRDAGELLNRYRFKSEVIYYLLPGCRFIARTNIGLPTEKFQEVDKVIPLAESLYILDSVHTGIVFSWILTKWVVRVDVGGRVYSLKECMSLPAKSRKRLGLLDRDKFQQVYVDLHSDYVSNDFLCALYRYAQNLQIELI